MVVKGIKTQRLGEKNYLFRTIIYRMLLFIGVTYTVSYRMDVFAWGNSKGDGLFLLVIPLWVFPP